MKFEERQDKDMWIEAIAVLNHVVKFEPFRRYDNDLFKDKQFTEADPVEFPVGENPQMDYMPDEYVAPVMVKIDGVTHRASDLTWFPLTDCADAIKLKQHETNQKVYPIFVKQGTQATVAIQNATECKYHLRLPTIPSYTDSEIK